MSQLEKTNNNNNKDIKDDEKKTEAKDKNELVSSNTTQTSKKYPVIVLMGDSVLDDFFWLENHSVDLEKILLKTFDNKIDVVNVAVDESTIGDVLRGKAPALTYVNGRHRYGLKPYPINKITGRVEPLSYLQQLIDLELFQHTKASSSKKKTTSDKNTTTVALPTAFEKSDPTIKPLVVLSAGGNNFREALAFGDIGPDVAGILQKVEESGLQEDYVRVLADLTDNKKLACNVIMVIVYEPHCDWLAGLLPREQMLQMLDWGVTRFLTVAEMYAIPVIDLSRTFNPFDRTHYGSTEIEPSDLSQQFICDLVYYIAQDFNFDHPDRKSKVYFGLKSDKNGITVQDNNEKTRKTYLDFMRKRDPKYQKQK